MPCNRLVDRTNLLNCNFAVAAPNRAWIGDIPTSQPNDVTADPVIDALLRTRTAVLQPGRAMISITPDPLGHGQPIL
ncbi:hypothetical protein [Tunturiibacter lichenicola]|uniref:hypothetical protein n=1 Tax=Tunturiibacter lichenicola TaxID=2051959 RepID=UPI003D9BE0CB